MSLPANRPLFSSSWLGLAIGAMLGFGGLVRYGGLKLVASGGALNCGIWNSEL